MIGANASNTFAKVLPPKATLCVYLNKQFRKWWEHKWYAPLSQTQRVMHVKKALQGHPKFTRLWVTLINTVILELGLKPCHHKPCLYINHDFKGKIVYFLCQVDGLAARTSDKTTKSIQINKSIPSNDPINTPSDYTPILRTPP